jgi:hypothetical protein
MHTNELEDSHPDAQIFSPPYLFRGDRPAIKNNGVPDEVNYGATFEVETPDANDIKNVNLLRLSSVTHSFNQNQRFNSLKFSVAGEALKVTSPANANQAPPGHYMLFILNGAGVPSTAKIVRLH